MKRVILGIAVTTFIGAIDAYAQCASAYTDGTHNSDASVLYAWSVLTDYWGQSCSAPWGTYTHTYYTTVKITSPTGRIATGSGYGQSSSGGENRADTSLSIL